MKLKKPIDFGSPHINKEKILFSFQDISNNKIEVSIESIEKVRYEIFPPIHLFFESRYEGVDVARKTLELNIKNENADIFISNYITTWMLFKLSQSFFKLEDLPKIEEFINHLLQNMNFISYFSENSNKKTEEINLTFNLFSNLISKLNPYQLRAVRAGVGEIGFFLRILWGEDYELWRKYQNIFFDPINFFLMFLDSSKIK